MKYLILTLLLVSCFKNKDCSKIEYKSFNHGDLVVILDGYYKGIIGFINGRAELEGADGCPVEAYKIGSVLLVDEEKDTILPSEVRKLTNEEIRKLYEKK